MDYKDTLFMGKTAFEMRGNLVKKEPLIEEEWLKMDLYHQILKKNEGRTPFVLHDGPPYANYDIHIGHALNKILKDFIVRHKNMTGYYAPFIPGWDTHGLPIENAVIKQGVKRKEISILEFRRLSSIYAKEQVLKQKKGFLRLGSLGDYDNPYLTLNKEYERDQVLVFAKMCERGLIYKGLKPIYWSYSSESALAEAEIEYYDKEDTSIYFRFPLISKFKDTSLLIWTTTPWTLPANLACAVGPQITYLHAKTTKGNFIFGFDLKAKLEELLDFKVLEVLGEYKGSDLEGIIYLHPLFDRTSPVIVADYVSTTDGTGIVHIAPGHGEDDFIASRPYNLEVLCPVDEHGVMTKEAGKYEGLFYEDCNKEIINDLKTSDLLLAEIKITHSYPHDWRTKKPIIFRATPQWFASISKIKPELLQAISEVKWKPKWGEVRLANMIKDRKDWCISRQRYWGVPLPIIYDENEEAIFDHDVFLHIADLFAKEGSDAWYRYEIKDLLPDRFKTRDLSKFKKELDTMDVWFDSGSSYMLLKREGLDLPCDLYLEGSDQYRGWFNSSLITAVAFTNKAPYKEVLSHGFTLDGNGRKMSKSLGNTIDPNKVCEQLGADILRLWVASVDYQSDMPISMDLLKQVSESYRKIRNTLRFMLANLAYFKVENILPEGELAEVDRYVLNKHKIFKQEVLSYFNEYRFGDIYRSLNLYLTNFLSSFYLDFTKDILYIDHPSSKNRLSVESVYFTIFKDLILLLAPILPHTMEEAYKLSNFFHKDSIFLEDIEPVTDIDYDLVAKYDAFFPIRDAILKELETARNNKIIGKSFEAEVTLNITPKEEAILNSLDVNLAQILIVSKVNLNSTPTFSVSVKKREGHLCPRCWSIVDELKTDVCKRCASVLERKAE